MKKKNTKTQRQEINLNTRSDLCSIRAVYSLINMIREDKRKREPAEKGRKGNA